jgi:biotin carboxyl carrier protein
MPSDLLEAPAAPDITALQALIEFDGTLDDFWPLYLHRLVLATNARRALLLSSSVGQPWRAHAQYPEQGAEWPEDARRSLRLLTQQSTESFVLPGADDPPDLCLRPAVGSDGVVWTVLLLQVASNLQVDMWQRWASMAAAVPRLYLRRITEREAASAHAWRPVQPGSQPTDPELQANEKAERLYDILRLVQRLSQQAHFVQAAIGVCNQLCSRMGAERVALGWRQGASIRLVAISHIEHFDAKSNSTRALEEVMEEAVDQEAVLVYPTSDDASAVLRAHEHYVRLLAFAPGQVQVCTVPMDGPEGVCAVLTLERLGRVFDTRDVWELQQVADAISPWLAHLQRQDRWWVLRTWDAMRRSLRHFLGPRHTGWKASGIALASAIVVAAWVPWDYRIDAALSVRSQDLLFMPAPFDGYLREVHVDVGDEVTEGTILVELDTRDLVLEASMADADLVRYTREAEKAMAARQLAEMQVALARQQQAAAKLELIRFQLAHAQVKAPYEGVVIEGELKKNLGAPVRRGDLLLKLARSERTFLEIEIDQADVHEVAVGSAGEFALVGRPGQRYPIEITKIDPAAVGKEGRTVYLARAQLSGAHQPDWRPGMGGNAKLEAGQRPLIWVLSHRTVRFLREFFWL